MAGRKEFEFLFKLQATLGGGFNSSFNSAMNVSKQLQGSLSKIHTLSGKIDGFQKQTAALQANRDKLAQLTEEHDRLQREMSQTEKPSEALRKKMERNARQIEQTTDRIEKQEARLGELGDELRGAGIDTGRLSEENNRLSKSYERVKKSQEKLAAIAQAQQKNAEAISKTKTQLVGTIGVITAMGAAIYAGPVKKAAEFEAQMSTVQAISNATGAEMQKLSDLAKKMGATTQFTAVEAGQALEYMAMAGWKTDQMIGGLPGIMNLAAASGEELGMVSDIVTDALTAFGMSAEDSGRFADVLAQASSNANTNVSMMGATFQKVAPVAGALGYTVEDMSLGIGLMANASIKAETAGTSLKTALANLAKPTDQMQIYMDKYGISLTHADGSMKTFREVVDNLRNSLGGLAENEQIAAASAIFGKESFAGMLAIVNASDTDFQKLSDSINHASGAAERMAAIKLDNLEGDTTLMKSAVDGLQISIGDALLPTFREGTRRLTELITKVTEFITQNPELVKTVMKVATGLAGMSVAGLGANLGFLELQKGVEGVEKVFALFKGQTADASVAAMTNSGKLATLGKNVAGYFGGVKNSLGDLGGSVDKVFGGKLGTLFSKFGGGINNGVLTPLRSLKNKIGGVLSGVGGKITGVFGQIGGAVVNGPLGKIGGVFKSLGGVASSVLGPAVQGLGGMFGGLFGKIMPIILIISALSALFIKLNDGDVSGFIEPLKKAFEQAKPVFESVKKQFMELGREILPLLMEAAQKLAPLFGQIVTAILPIILELIQQLVPLFIQIIQTILPVILDLLTQLAPLFTNIITAVLPVLQQLIEALIPIFTQFIESVLPVVIDLITTVVSEIQPLVEAILPVLQQLLQALKPIIQAVAEMFGSVLGSAINAISGILNGLTQVLQGIITFITGVFTGNWKQAWEGIKSIFSGIWEAIKSVCTGVVNGIISVINTVIKGLNCLKIPDWVPGIGGVGINIPLIPMLEKGSNYTPDTFIAGDVNGKGGELVTNARGRKVFTAAQTGQIFDNINRAREQSDGTTVVTMLPMLQAALSAAKNAAGAAPQLQMAYAGAMAGGVDAPTVTVGEQRATSVVVHSAPVFHVGTDAQAEDIEEILRQRDEELLNEFDDRLKQKEDDERRRRYD